MMITWRNDRHRLNRRCKRRCRCKRVVVTQYACFGARRVSKQSLQHRLNRRLSVHCVVAMTSAKDGSWSSAASRQAKCDQLN
jgi:hypothetical protein